MANELDGIGFLTKQTGARYAGVSIKTFERWFGKGLPFIQVTPRGRILVKRSDLDQFLINKRVDKKDSLEALIDEVSDELSRTNTRKPFILSKN